MPQKLTALAQTMSPTMMVLIALSTLTLSLGLERLFYVVRYRRRLATRRRMVLAHLGDHAASAAQQANSQMPHHPAGALFDLLLGPQTVRLSAVRRHQAQLIRDAKKRLWILGSVGSIAPFVGLLGTVLGVMEAFTAMGAEGAGGFAVVSTGLSEALVTTAAGIFVAVEAVVLFNYLQVGIAHYAAELKETVEEIAEHMEVAHGPARTQ
jgi:biopolymer transport protein ExbB